MSDWFGSRSTAPTVNAGLDLEMPGPTRDRGEKLVAAVQAGDVSPETVRTRARNMVRLMARVGSLGDHRAHLERAIDRAEHRALIRRAGAEGTVLLRNDGILPLAKEGRIAVIGPNARVAQIMGGGSAQLNPHDVVSPWQGLANAVGEAALRFAPGCTNHRFEPVLTGDFKVEFLAGKAMQGPVLHSEILTDLNAFWIPPLAAGKVDQFNFSARLTGSFVLGPSGLHRVGVFAAGYAKVFVDGNLIANAWDGWKKGRTFFEAVAVAGAADRAVVFVGRSGEWDTEGSDLEGLGVPSRTLMVQSFPWNGRRHYGPDSSWYEPGQVFIQWMKTPAVGHDD